MQNTYTYKMKFFPLVLCVTIFAVLIFSGLILLTEGGSINWYAYKIAIITIVTFSTFWSFFMVFYYKTTLKSEGIKGFNFWGKYRFVKWGNISKVKSINFLGLKYLRVFTTNTGLALWVPLFIKNTGSFKEQARLLPPEGNAFRDYYTR